METVIIKHTCMKSDRDYIKCKLAASCFFLRQEKRVTLGAMGAFVSFLSLCQKVSIGQQYAQLALCAVHVLSAKQKQGYNGASTATKEAQ